MVLRPFHCIFAERKTMKRLLALVCLAVLTLGTQASDELKPRIVVLTDIAPGNIEPDDMESMVRLMAYADLFEIEALITTTGWNCDPYPAEWADSLYRVIDAYEQDVSNLMKRSRQKRFLPLAKEQGQQRIGYWPSPEYLRSRVAMGSRRAGIAVIGEANRSAGSDLIVKLVDEDDPRPLWICCWGGANTLAQAIWQVKQQRTTAELRKFLRKLRVYTITDQDMHYSMRHNRAYSSHQWMRREFADDLLFIWDESAWLTQCELGSKGWQQYASEIQGKGQLGSVYPKYKYGVEGDTPSFLHVMPNGLHNPDAPEQIGWAGCFKRGISPDSLTTAWTNWQQPQKNISRSYEERFYPAIFCDFAARMAWAQNGTGNRNPIVIVNGNKGIAPIEINVRPNGALTLDASRSFNPDRHQLTFRWWIQSDIGSNAEEAILKEHGSQATISIPTGGGKSEIHIICEVEDNGTIPLCSYRRIIVRCP